MALNRNARYIMRYKDIIIELRCGSQVDSEFYFLPDDMIVGDLEINGAFDDDLPIGISNALTCKIKINTESFTSEMAELGAWIRNNETAPQIPNVWIVYKNNIVEYIGVQEPSIGVKHSIKAKEFELNLTSIHKYALEKIQFLLSTPTDVSDTELDAMITDYIKVIGTDCKGTSYYRILGWGRTKFVNYYPWIYDIWLKKIGIVIDVVLRNSTPLELVINKQLPTFYKPVLADDGTKPTAEATYFELKAIAEIWQSESEIFDLADLKGGLLQTYYQQFKTLWNFYKVFLRGQAKRCEISHVGSISINDATFKPSIGIILNELYIVDNAISPIVIDAENIEATSNDEVISEPYNTYRSVTNRNMVNRSTDVRQVEVLSSGGSTAKNRYETFCCIGNSGNTVELHYKDEVSALGFEHAGVTEYQASAGTSIPCTQLLIHNIPAYNPSGYWGEWLKIADYCRIPCSYSGGEFIESDELSYNNTLMNIDGLDNFNKAINQRQSNGYAKLCADIINEVIAKRQTTVNITLSLDIVGINNLGMEFTLNIADVYKTNYFYDNIEFGTKAILTNIKANYSKGTADCIFFIRNDIYES